MTWRVPPAPLRAEDEYDVRCGMAPDQLGRDLLLQLEREDRMREYGPTDEQRVASLLYGEATRSGLVTPCGVDRVPIDPNWMAA